MLKNGDFVSILPKKDLKSSIVKSYLRIPSKIDFVNNESFELD